jgi:hypothetical protein
VDAAFLELNDAVVADLVTPMLHKLAELDAAELNGKKPTKRMVPKLVYDDLNRVVCVEGGGFKAGDGNGLKYVRDKKGQESSKRFDTPRVEKALREYFNAVALAQEAVNGEGLRMLGCPSRNVWVTQEAVGWGLV